MEKHIKLINKSLFISRELDEESLFIHLKKEYNLTIHDIPLIQIVKIPFSHTPVTNWIFFSSKNAIRYFFAQNPSISSDVKFGVISNSSKIELNKFDKKAAFIGEGTNLLEISKKFRDILQNESVLFPQAMDSLQTIQKQLAFTNIVYNLYTYKTIIKTELEIPYTDIVILTSPSNARAYLTKYKLDSRQIIIVMGTSTKYELMSYGIKNIIMPNEFSESGLIESLKKNMEV